MNSQVNSWEIGFWKNSPLGKHGIPGGSSKAERKYLDDPIA